MVGGFVVCDGGLKWFEVVGVDGMFVVVDVWIDGESVVVCSVDVLELKVVWYVWVNFFDGGYFYNGVGLLVVQFWMDVMK